LLARERMRALCDSVDLPSSQARALIDDVTLGRSFFGAEGYLPAVVDLVPFSTYLPDDAIFLLDDPPGITRAVREELERADEGAAARADRPRFDVDVLFATEAHAADSLARASVVALHRTVTISTEVAPHTLEQFESTPDEDVPTLGTSG